MAFDLAGLFDFGWAPNEPYRVYTPVTTVAAGDTSYTLSFVEFDDQGWYFDIGQRAALKKYLDAQSGPHLVIVFLHGWKHNASPKDRNVETFQNLLSQAAISEARRGRGRKVLGVYLSWRGLTVHGLRSEDITFWTRKDAASRVAVGSIREVLAILKSFRDRLDPKPGPEPAANDPDTRLIVVGHSFGGLILFSALMEYLLESALAPTIISPFGDLVILINPAFEATRYQALVTALESRRGFESNQRSVFVAFTATNDWATGYAFPIGRWLGTRLESVRQVPPTGRMPADAQRQANLKTIGHLPWLTTHTLSTTTTPAGQQRNAANHEAERSQFDDFNRTFRPHGKLKEKWHRAYQSGAELRHVGGDPNNPFWVVETSPQVIDGHNDINKKVFVDFLGQFINDRLTPL